METREAAYALAKREDWLKVREWMETRAKEARVQAQTPCADWPDILHHERLKSAFITIEALLLSFDGMVAARAKDVEDAQKAEFEGQG